MKISVIIPVYNSALFLERAVKSVLIQPEVKEILLIEDCSSDNSLVLCKKLAQTYNHIKLHQNLSNLGAGATRNIGIKAAKYPFIAFLDADDYYYSNRFSKTKLIFDEKPNADAVSEAFETIIEDEKAPPGFYNDYKKRSSKYLNTQNEKYNLFEQLVLAQNGYIHLNGLTVKRDIINKIGYFDEILKQTQDTDFIFRLALTRDIEVIQNTSPVSARTIHGFNRVLNQNNARRFKVLFAKKWLLIMLQQSWSKPINRVFFMKYLEFSKLSLIFKDYWNWYILRLLFKSMYSFFLIFKYPRLLIKIL